MVSDRSLTCDMTARALELVQVMIGEGERGGEPEGAQIPLPWLDC